MKIDHTWGSILDEEPWELAVWLCVVKGDCHEIQWVEYLACVGAERL